VASSRIMTAAHCSTEQETYDPVVADAAKNTGLVSYAGAYIGLCNVNGVNTDLAPTAGTPRRY
jgi:predicted RNA methylase